jgi:hypothetical protein
VFGENFGSMRILGVRKDQEKKRTRLPHGGQFHIDIAKTTRVKDEVECLPEQVLLFTLLFVWLVRRTIGHKVIKEDPQEVFAVNNTRIA